MYEDGLGFVARELPQAQLEAAAAALQRAVPEQSLLHRPGAPNPNSWMQQPEKFCREPCAPLQNVFTR